MKNTVLFPYRFLQTYIHLLLLVIMLVVLTVLLFLPALIFPAITFPLSVFVCRACLFTVGVTEVIIFGQIPDDDKKYVVIADHHSFIEIFLLIIYFRGQRGSVIANKKLIWFPFVNLWLLLLKIIMIKPKALRGWSKGLEKAKRFLKEKKGNIAIFPTGTRSKDGKIAEFKRGFAQIAMDSGSDIIPIGFGGTFQFKPKSRWWIKPGKVVIMTGLPIRIEGKTEKEIMLLSKESVERCAKTATEVFRTK